MKLAGHGLFTLQNQALASQGAESDTSSKMREGIVVLTILSPAILGLILTSFPMKSGRT